LGRFNFKFMVIKFPRLKNYSIPKDILTNKDWYEKKGNGVLFSTSVIIFGNLWLINKRYQQAFQIAISYIKDGKMSWLWDNRDLKRIRRQILDLVKNKPQQINIYLRQWRQDLKEFKKIIKILEKIDWKILSDRGLYRQYLKLRDAYSRANSLPYLVDSFLSAGESDWLADLIARELRDKVISKKQSDLITCLIAPVFNSFINREYLDLLRLAIKLKNNHSQVNTSLEKLFKKYANRYYWIENSYYPKDPLDSQYFKEKIFELLKNKQPTIELKKELNRAKNNYSKKRKLFKKLKLSSNLKKIIHVSEIFSAWQDERKANVLIANHFFFLILKEIGRRTGLSPQEMYYTIDQELPDILFNKKFNRKHLRSRRKNGCLFIGMPQGIYLVEGREAKKYQNIFFKHNDSLVTELKGVSACPGLAKGLVQIITGSIDYKKFKIGEILVANNTTPDFVPMMKKAAAIITEQGGITTHAAIISRELKIPCVIGTKIATQVLKTGDLVEVNASLGLIKIIK